MMTNELLTREDFLPAGARARGRQAGQQLMRLSVSIFYGSALISHAEGCVRSQMLNAANSRLQLLGELKEVLQQSKQSTKQWLKSSEVRKMLGISHGTLQNLRITRSLPYTKLGGIMFYKYEDIEKILEAGLVSKKY